MPHILSYQTNVHSENKIPPINQSLLRYNGRKFPIPPSPLDPHSNLSTSHPLPKHSIFRIRKKCMQVMNAFIISLVSQILTDCDPSRSECNVQEGYEEK